MIHMPHRSVTRFFVPLIDVLLLLFCIFLLMPFANEDDMEKTQEEAVTERDKATMLDNEVRRLDAEAQNQQVNREALKKEGEYERMKAENELLRKRLAEPPGERFNFHVVHIKREDGELFVLNSRGKPETIKSAKDAQELFRRDRLEAEKSPLTKGKRLYYCLVYPRPQAGFPDAEQIEEYKKWFADVEISFVKGGSR